MIIYNSFTHASNKTDRGMNFLFYYSEYYLIITVLVAPPVSQFFKFSLNCSTTHSRSVGRTCRLLQHSVSHFFAAISFYSWEVLSEKPYKFKYFYFPSTNLYRPYNWRMQNILNLSLLHKIRIRIFFFFKYAANYNNN